MNPLVSHDLVESGLCRRSLAVLLFCRRSFPLVALLRGLVSRSSGPASRQLRRRCNRGERSLERGEAQVMAVSAQRGCAHTHRSAKHVNCVR